MNCSTNGLGSVAAAHAGTGGWPLATRTTSGPTTRTQTTPVNHDVGERVVAEFTVRHALRLLSVLAYNLGNLWRRLVLPKRIDTWSLTSLRQRLVETGGRLLKHARYYWLLLAEGHLTRRLFGATLQRIRALPVPAS
jgi:hypothetical protein